MVQSLPHLVFGYLGRLAKHFVCDSEIFHVEQQRGRTNIFDTPGVEANRFGNLGSAHRNAVGVGFAVLLVSKKILQDHQHAVITVFHFTQRLLVALVKCSGDVTGDHENYTPECEIEPARVKRQIYAAREHAGIYVDQQHDQDDACDGSQSGVAASKVIGRIKCWKEIENQCHLLRRDQKIQHRSDQHKKQQQPEFRIDLAHSPSRGSEGTELGAEQGLRVPTIPL